MTREEKELLIKKVLCEQLPYGVQVEIEGYHNGILKGIDGGTVTTDRGINYPLRFVKPYLRPLSSMTEEERKELSNYLCERVMSDKSGITIPPNPTHGKGIGFDWMGDCIDWLNKYHFDYRGLIEMGLAIAAVGNNNPYKER